MPPIESSQIGNSNLRTELTNLNQIVQAFMDPRNSAQLLARPVEVGSPILPALQIEGENTQSLQVAGEAATMRHRVVTGGDAQGGQHRTDIRFNNGQPDRIVCTHQGRNVELTRDENGWQITEGTPPVTRRVDNVSVRGEGRNTEVVVQEGNNQTVIRADGSRVRETTGPNGSSHREITNAAGALVGIEHNGLHFDVRQTGSPPRYEILSPNGNPIPGASYDAATRELRFQRMGLQVALRPDGSTVADRHSAGPPAVHARTIGFGDGSRVYQDITDPNAPRTIGFRRHEAGRPVYYDLTGPQVRVRDGQGNDVPSPFAGRPTGAVELVGTAQQPEGMRLRGVPAANQETIAYLDGHSVVRNQANRSIELRDSSNPPQVLGISRDANHVITSIQPPGGPPVPEAISVGPNANQAESISVDERRGIARAVMRDGSTVTFDMTHHTRTTERANQRTVEHFDRGFTERFTDGRQDRLTQNGIEWQLTTAPNGSITEARFGDTRYQSPPSTIEVNHNDGSMSVRQPDGTQITYRPERVAGPPPSVVSVHVERPGSNHAADIRLDGNGRPVAITQRRPDRSPGASANATETRQIVIHRNGAGAIENITDNGQPLRLNGRELEQMREMTITPDGRLSASLQGVEGVASFNFGSGELTMRNGNNLHVENSSGTLDMNGDGRVRFRPATPPGAAPVEVPLVLPAGASINPATFRVSPTGVITYDLQGGGGRVEIDQNRRTASLVTPERTTTWSQNSRVETDRTGDRPTRTRIYGSTDGNQPAYTVEYHAAGPNAGQIARLTDHLHGNRVIENGLNNQRMRLDGDSVVLERGPVANPTERAILRADGSREITTNIGTGEGYTRNRQGWVTERHGPRPGGSGTPERTTFTYHMGPGGEVEIANVNGQQHAVPESIAFGNGRTLTRRDGFGDDNTSFVLRMPGPPQRERAFTTATVDRQGTVHLHDAQGNRWSMNGRGELKPEHVALANGVVVDQNNNGRFTVTRPGQPPLECTAATVDDAGVMRVTAANGNRFRINERGELQPDNQPLPGERVGATTFPNGNSLTPRADGSYTLHYRTQPTQQFRDIQVRNVTRDNNGVIHFSDSNGQRFTIDRQGAVAREVAPPAPPAQDPLELARLAPLENATAVGLQRIQDRPGHFTLTARLPGQAADQTFEVTNVSRDAQNNLHFTLNGERYTINNATRRITRDGAGPEATFTDAQNNRWSRDAQGRVIPEQVRCSNGTTLTHLPDGTFRLTTQGPPQRSFRIQSATVDNNGIIHLTQRRANGTMSHGTLDSAGNIRRGDNPPAAGPQPGFRIQPPAGAPGVPPAGMDSEFPGPDVQPPTGGFGSDAGLQPGANGPRPELGPITNFGNNSYYQRFRPGAVQPETFTVAHPGTGQPHQVLLRPVSETGTAGDPASGRPSFSTRFYVDQSGQLAGMRDSEGRMYVRSGRDPQTGHDIWVNPNTGESRLVRIRNLDQRTGHLHFTLYGSNGRMLARPQQLVMLGNQPGQNNTMTEQQ